MKRITIDLPEKEYKKYKLEALQKDVPVKILIQEKLIADAKSKPDLEKVLKSD